MAKWRSPFKAISRETCSFKKKGSWAAGYHTGVDRVCDSNKALVAPCDCTVKRNEYSDSYGNFVVLLTNDGKSILMAHMKSKSSLKVGAKIASGTSIGTMGNTGNSSGTHLHIEVVNSKTWAYNKNLLNPNDYIDWNCFSNGSSNDMNFIYNEFPKAVKWSNGSSKETVFKQNDLTDEIGEIFARETGKCYSKSGNSYVVVYNLDGTNKHKVGFVKYAGGVKKAPPESKVYKNGSTEETVYADTAKKTVVGSLNKYESCYCLGKIDGMYLVLYAVSGSNTQKCGFVAYDGGVE